MYYFYLDDMLLPVPPKEVQTSIKNQNKTTTLINNGEINRLKDAGLTSVSFEFLIPHTRLPFALYDGGFQGVGYYLQKLEKLKTDKKPFQFKILRELPNGTKLFDTGVKVSLEDYKLKESQSNNFDTVVSINLKHYKDFELKTYTQNSNGTASVSKQRETSNSPEPKTQSNNYTVVKGDTLYNIAKKQYGDGSKYTEIAKANGITNPNIISVGKNLILPVL